MQTYRHITVEPDGRIRIPDVKPGQRLRVTIEPETEATPERLTLATARTAEERAQVFARVHENARKLRELLKDDLPTSASADELYGEDGLPK